MNDEYVSLIQNWGRTGLEFACLNVFAFFRMQQQIPLAQYKVVLSQGKDCHIQIMFGQRVREISPSHPPQCECKSEAEYVIEMPGTQSISWFSKKIVGNLPECLVSKHFRSVDRDLSLPMMPKSLSHKNNLFAWQVSESGHCNQLLVLTQFLRVKMVICFYYLGMQVPGSAFNDCINKCVDDQVPYPTPSLQNSPAPLYVLSLEKMSFD